MHRIWVVLLLMVPLVAKAQASRPALTPPATQPSFEPGLDQAVALMRENKYDKAAPLLEKIYAATSPEQRSRGLVLNHAIVDLTRKVYVMRALRDLDQYLTKHRAED